MLKKAFEINNESLKANNYFLFYGSNEGAKNEKISELFLKINRENVQIFDEKEILDRENDFFQSILSKSLFEENKIIRINRATDKVLKIISEILKRNIKDIKIILNSGVLEKKSKLRNFFEKDSKLTCVPFYDDTTQTLSNLTKSFFSKNKIIISQSDINLLISRANGDRGALYNELNKIKFYSMNKKKISTSVILKLTNLIENYSISELIDNCLAKNMKKTLKILNENNFNSEDCIIISRMFLNKAKKLLILRINYEKNNSLELTINNFKPPIFWKDKEITKQQVTNWKSAHIKELIYQLNKIELYIKKNINNSVNIISDFILENTVKNN